MMDEWLDERGLYRKNTALDGTCLFRAAAEHLLPANSITGHQILRKMCVDYLLQHRSDFIDKICGDFDEYVSNLMSPKGWGTTLELEILSRIFRVDFLVFFGPESPIEITQNHFKKQHLLCVTGVCFYDAVHPKQHIENLGFCQSLVYKLLYEVVFKLSDLDYAVTKMLHDKAARAKRERFLAQQQAGGEDPAYDSYVEDDGTLVNVREVIESGAILFPYKVAKALDPDIYRNVEFDNWVESQRGKPLLPHCSCVIEVSRRSNNLWLLSGGPLRVGVKCQVRWQGRIFTAHVHELSPDRGPAVVYIEEFSQKMTVPYEDLIPLPRMAIKPDWSYSHKLQMISRLAPRVGCNAPVDHRAIKLRGRRSELECSSNMCSSLATEADSTGTSPATSPKTTNHSLIYTQNDTVSKWSIVNKNAIFSVCEDCSDLPLDDLPTLRFFYNMGIEYFHKGTYICDSPKVYDDSNLEMVQVCQGAPLIQPPPPTQPPPFPIAANSTGVLISTPPPPIITGPPPTMGVCPPSPLIACQPLPLNASTPLYAATPAPEMDSLPPRACEMTPAAREGKERGRNKFNKPPRFQRLESAKAAQRCEMYADEPQNPEVSSTTMEPSPLPIAVMPPMQIPSIPFIFDPDNAEPIGYLDPVPYQEYPPMMPLIEPAIFLDGDTSGYQYYMLPHVPVYY